MKKSSVEKKTPAAAHAATASRPALPYLAATLTDGQRAVVDHLAAHFRATPNELLASCGLAFIAMHSECTNEHVEGIHSALVSFGLRKRIPNVCLEEDYTFTGYETIEDGRQAGGAK